MTYTAMQISKYMVRQTKGSISNLKLQKMLFYAQMIYIQLYNEKLFSDKIEAWRHGPVVRDVYRNFKKYMSSLIPNDAQEFDDIDDISYEDSKTLQVVNEVIEKTKDISAWDLVAKTHETSAWENNFVEDCNNEIPLSDMRSSKINIGD